MTAHATDNTEEIRQRILEAATRRFEQFGYNKTTMAEIAQDCQMSAANLYRYFENKQDIGANLAAYCLSTKVETLHQIVQQKHRPAAERLNDLVLQSLHYTYQQWSENPRMNELVTVICESCLDVVDSYKQNEHQILAELISDGINNKEFNITPNDIDDYAYAITTAITAFNLPILMPLYPLSTFEQRARSVVKLMLGGLKNT